MRSPGRIVSGCVLTAALAWFALAPSAFPAEEALRTWTDISGEHKLEARLVRVAAGAVVLEFADRTQVEIDLDKLSAADREYASARLSQAESNPFKVRRKAGEAPSKSQAQGKDDAQEDADDEPAVKPDDEENEEEEPADESDEGADEESDDPSKVIDVDFEKAAAVELSPRSKTWSLDIGASFHKPPSKMQSVEIGADGAFFEKLSGLAVCPTAEMAVVGFLNPTPGEVGTRLEVYSSKTGKRRHAVKSSREMTPLALHHDGRQIIMRGADFPANNRNQLEWWSISGRRVVKKSAWTPYVDGPEHFQQVTWAEFISEDRLATASLGGQILIWSFPDIVPQYSLQVAEGCLPAISRDRKWLAYCAPDHVGVFDLEANEVAVQRATPSRAIHPILGFSPSGERLVCATGGSIWAWDAATGVLECNANGPGVDIESGACVGDDRFVLLANVALFDLEFRTWGRLTDSVEAARCALGWMFLSKQGDPFSGSTLAITKYPDRKTRAVMEDAAEAATICSFEDGLEVAIDVSKIHDEDERESVKAALTKSLTSLKCKLDDNAELVLSAVIDGPKRRNIAHREANASPLRFEESPFEESISRLRFLRDGKVLWETSDTNIPAAVADGARGILQAAETPPPNYEFFSAVKLPDKLYEPPIVATIQLPATLAPSREDASPEARRDFIRRKIEALKRRTRNFPPDRDDEEEE